MKKVITILVIAGLALSSCGLCHHIPSTSSTINVRDSVAVHWIDSIRVTEKSVYKDYTSLLDTLRIKVEGRASMAAWADTTHNVIAGELQTEPVTEKTKILYKDRIKEVHDTTKIEVPVKVEVEKIVKVVPKFWRITGVLGLISVCALIVLLLKRFKIL